MYVGLMKQWYMEIAHYHRHNCFLCKCHL